MSQERQKLIIIGAGGFSKELLWLLKKSHYNFEILGLLDICQDKPARIGYSICDIPILGGLEQIEIYKDSVSYVMALGKQLLRLEIYEKLKEISRNFMTLIDNTAQYSNYVNIDFGTIVCANTVCTVDIKIGKFSLINVGCFIGHDSNIGDFCTLACHVVICGNVKIGNMVEIGTGAMVLPNVNVGDNVMICAGTVVDKDIPSNSKAIGNPMRIISC